MSTKLRVLCLHGYRQSGEKLRGRIAAFRRTFKSSVEFVCVDAPIVVPYEPTNEEHASRAEQSEKNGELEDVRQFSWWNYQINEVTGEHSYSHVTQSIEYLADICREQGPFDGVFGFSQGGMMASLLLQLQQTKKDEFPFVFSFGIFVSAASSRDPRYIYCQDKIKFPSLHIMGTTDAIVTVDRSRELAATFEDPVVFEHPGGHYIPANKDPKDAMRAFIKDAHSRVHDEQPEAKV